MRRRPVSRAAGFACLLIGSALFASVARPGGASPGLRAPAFAPAHALRATVFVFPRDDGMHANFTREWWRVFGFLRTRDGRNLDVSATFYRAATRPYPVRAGASAWSVPEFYSAAFGIAQAASLRFVSRSRIERPALDLATAQNDRLSVRVGTWRLAGGAARRTGSRKYLLRVQRDGAGLSLDLIPGREALPLGRGGIERTGECSACEIYGYAYPRAHATGTVVLDGKPLAVSGSMWLDHEYGTTLQTPAERGNVRIAVQFADGRDLLITASRDAHGDARALGAVLVRRDGSTAYYGPGEIRLSGGRFAVDSNGTRFPPSFFSIEVPAAGLQVAAEPKPGDPEIVGPPGAPAFFEGAADVSRYNPPDGDIGRAFVEVTGYDTASEP